MEFTLTDIARLVIEGAIAGSLGIYFNQIDRRRERQEKERIEAEQERYAREQERIARMALIEEALTAMLRDRIIQSCRFFINKGNIPPFERENICRMYHAYHDGLGGNDIASDIYHKMMELELDI